MSVVAAAVVVSGAVGAYQSNKNAKRAQQSADQMTEAGREAAQLGRDQFDWYKQEYERTRPQRESAAALDLRIADQQYEGMQYAMDQAREQERRRKGVFEPLENQLVQDALAFDDDARASELRGKAGADVDQAFAGVRGQGARNLMRLGVNPADGKFRSLDQQTTTQQALAKAGAMTKAGRDARAEGYAKRMDAIGLGRGIVGSQATMQQIAQSGGNAAVGAAGAGVNVNQSGAGLMGQGFGSAMQGFNTMSGLFGQAGRAQNTADFWTGERNKAFGSVLGAGADALGSAMPNFHFGLSDEKKKKRTGTPADTDKALDEVMATPVHEGWEYDETKGAPPGSGGVKHRGPMAQDVRKTMGEKAAPGGEVIDFIEVNGTLMAAMQGLAKRVQQLEQAA
jgi:hypothetical protein